MRFALDNWFRVGAVVVIPMSILAALFAADGTIATVMVIQCAALAAHQFEEYAWPGGFPLAVNFGVFRSPLPLADRYPLNQLSSMLLNVGFLYLVFIPTAVWFSDVTWLVLGIALFGLSELAFHLVFVAASTRVLFNPGLITSLALFLPLAAIAIWHVVDTDLASGTDWLFAALFVVVSAGGIVRGLVFTVFADRESKYPFPERELMRGPFAARARASE